MLVAEGAGRWICWTLFVWGIVTGCPLRGRGWHMGLRVPGGVPFCRQPCTPSVNPRAELRLPGLPRLLRKRPAMACSSFHVPLPTVSVSGPWRGAN